MHAGAAAGTVAAFGVGGSDEGRGNALLLDPLGAAQAPAMVHAASYSIAGVAGRTRMCLLQAAPFCWTTPLLHLLLQAGCCAAAHQSSGRKPCPCCSRAAFPAGCCTKQAVTRVRGGPHLDIRLLHVLIDIIRVVHLRQWGSVDACWCCQARQNDVLAVLTSRSALHGSVAGMRGAGRRRIRSNATRYCPGLQLLSCTRAWGCTAPPALRRCCTGSSTDSRSGLRVFQTTAGASRPITSVRMWNSNRLPCICQIQDMTRFASRAAAVAQTTAVKSLQ